MLQIFVDIYTIVLVFNLNEHAISPSHEIDFQDYSYKLLRSNPEP